MSTTNTDYWAILGISPDSNLEQIKSAFRKEARRWHPDLNINDINAEERFKLVNEAYAVLSDPIKRKKWESNSYFEVVSDDLFADGFPSYQEYMELVLGINNDVSSKVNDNNEYVEEYEIEVEQEFEDNFDQEVSNFNNESYKPARTTKAPPPIKKAKDIETIIELSPEEALKGTCLQIELIDGTIVEINTPPFSGDGWRLKLAGVASGGQDHFIQLRVQTDEGLRIDGLRVLYRLELFPHDALFGCAVDIPTLEGTVTLQVPPNSSSGRLLRLRGRGMEFDELVGDQIVEVVIVIPAELSESELALYRRLQELAFEEGDL